MKLVLQYFYKKRQVIGWSILCGLILSDYIFVERD